MTTVAAIQNKVNLFIADSTNNSVSASDRLSAISQATQNLMADTGFDHFNATYPFDCFDTVTRYDITTNVPDMFEPSDLRRGELVHVDEFIRKQSRDLSVDIGRGLNEISFGIDRYNTRTYLLIDYSPQYPAQVLHDCESYNSNGLWVADTLTSDALNVATDSVLFQVGAGSVSFDVAVAQSVNNFATISNASIGAINLSSVVNLASMFIWVYIPSVTNFSSVTAYWGSSSSAYWSYTATTDYNGSALVVGWNRIKFPWASATKTGTPNASATTYLRFDMNFTGSYLSQTGFRIDQIIMVRPETLTFFYETYYIGKSSGGSSLMAYTATTDVPWYSGMYDFFDNPIAHGAATILFREMMQEDRATREEKIYMQELTNLRQRLPSSQLKESRAFKVRGINFNKRKTR